MKRVIFGVLPVCFAVACSSDRRPVDSPASSDAQYTGTSSSASAADTSDGSSVSVADRDGVDRDTDSNVDTRSSVVDRDSAREREAERARDATPTTTERRDATKAPVAADNTKVNERDRDAASVTPTDQGENRSDLDITQRIRQAVMADDTLSFTAKNAKIITENGRVTLRGVVKTEQERTAIAAAAGKVAGTGNVVNQLEVKK